MRYRFQVLVLLFSLLVVSSSASAHVGGMAGSKWFFGNNRMVAVLELSPKLLADIPGIKEGHYPVVTFSKPKVEEAMTKVVQPYLDQKLSLVVNGKQYPVRLVKMDRKTDTGWEVWLVADQIALGKNSNDIKIDYRLLFDETDDTHVNLAYIYASDAAVGSVPNNLDESALIDRTNFTSNTRVWEGSVQGQAVQASPAKYLERIRELVLYGVKHILTGYDHIAFLLALIAIGLSLKEALKTVTAFTIAHSITLLLATLQIVSLDSRFVETMIALSICYVALENLLRKEANYRWLITFGFGLIHGFGFASGVRELVVGRSDLVVSVLCFNVGVEIGQLAIFLVLLPLFYLLKRKVEFRKVTVATSAAVFLIGFAWLIERIFNVAVVPAFLS